MPTMETISARPTLPWSRKDHAAASRALGVQFWCWGQDIKRPAGNLLLEYGFSRQRPPDGIAGSSQYTLERAPGEWTVLWGFGVFYGLRPHGGLFLLRNGFTPYLLAAPPLSAWSPAEIPFRAPVWAADEARLPALLGAALGWLAAYERWVQATAGAAYRQECIDRGARTRLTAESLAATWERLVALCGSRGDGTA